MKLLPVTILFNFIFYFSLFQIMISLFFLNIKISKYIIITNILLAIILSPLLYFADNSAVPTGLHIITAAGLSVIPFFYSLLIFIHYEISGKRTLSIISFISLISLVCTFLLYDHNYMVILLFHISVSMALFVILFKNTQLFGRKLLQFFLLMNTGYLLFNINAHWNRTVTLILCVPALIIFFIILLDHRIKFKTFVKQQLAVSEINKKLHHRLTRQKQTNEQYKRIIKEKELELLQTSRHASLAEITTGIAHELTQPLTGIRGLAQNLIDDINYEEFDNMQAVSDLLKICSLVDKSTTIINHVRNFSKKSGFSLRLIDINKTILNAIDLINLQLKENYIDIVFLLNENIPKILGDNVSLEQLIVNIILNAKDAIIEKQKKIPRHNGEIKITTDFSDNSIKIAIEDNGTGISEELVPKIWSPFFSTKKRTHGTGIGLSISRKILRAHNADADIITNSSGTKFIFTFPVYENHHNRETSY